jgi:hypothetical protein
MAHHSNELLSYLTILFLLSVDVKKVKVVMTELTIHILKINIIILLK